MESQFELIAKTFQGLESVLANELTALGAENVAVGRRMVSFSGNKELMYKANFALRTAVRILKPIKHFKASTADEVYKEIKAIPWADYIAPNTTFAVDSVVYSQDFRHSKFVAYKVKDAIVDYFQEQTGDRPNICVADPDLQLNIHISENDCTLSLDSSGESLHKRGYRQQTIDAPINEVLAAGLVLLSGWNGDCDLIDPMCGSGTIAIEAGLIARGIAPGIFRKKFAFEKWSDFDKQLLDRIYNDDSQERPFTHHIFASDISRDALIACLSNVKAAGLANEISVFQQDFRQFSQPKEKSVIIMNPPYGERLANFDLPALYHTIGERLKHQFVGGDAWIIGYREECFEAIGLKPSLKIPLFNGSLECEFRHYQIFDGRYNDMRARGGSIKTDEERRQMAEKHRFKRHREFNRSLDDDENAEYDYNFRSRPNRKYENSRSFRDANENRYRKNPNRFGRDSNRSYKSGSDVRNSGGRPYSPDYRDRRFDRRGGAGGGSYKKNRYDDKD